MNSCWNENLIIFAMALISTRFHSWIKIRIFGPTRDRLWVKLVQSCHKSPRSSGFVRVLTSFDLWSNLRLTMGILAKRDISGAPVSERVALRHSGCSCGPKERKLYFGVFQGSTRKLKVEKIWYQQDATRILLGIS